MHNFMCAYISFILCFLGEITFVQIVTDIIQICIVAHIRIFLYDQLIVIYLSWIVKTLFEREVYEYFGRLFDYCSLLYEDYAGVALLRDLQQLF